MPFDQRSLIHREAWFPGCDGQTQKHTDIATYRKNRPKGRFFENSWTKRDDTCWRFTPLSQTLNKLDFFVCYFVWFWLLVYISHTYCKQSIWNSYWRQVRQVLQTLSTSIWLTSGFYFFFKLGCIMKLWNGVLRPLIYLKQDQEDLTFARPRHKGIPGNTILMSVYQQISPRPPPPSTKKHRILWPFTTIKPSSKKHT